VAKRAGVLELFHPAVAEWFRASFDAPTPPQTEGWPAIARGESTLILAPTGSGKTLTAFLWAINRVMFPPSLAPAPARATVDKSIPPLAPPLARRLPRRSREAAKADPPERATADLAAASSTCRR